MTEEFGNGFFLGLFIGALAVCTAGCYDRWCLKRRDLQ